MRVLVALPDQENEYQLLQAADARATAARLGSAVEILDAQSHPVQVEIGRAQGRQLRALLPAGGHVLCIHGPQASMAARERFQGLSEVVGSAMRLTVLDGQWSEANAETAVRSWLRLKIWEATPGHAIAAQDDSMARGAGAAIEALPDLGPWSAVKFLGIDGVPAYGQKLVDQGRLHATVVMPSNTGPALELVDRWLKSGQLPPAKVQLPVQSYPALKDLAAARPS